MLSVLAYVTSSMVRNKIELMALLLAVVIIKLYYFFWVAHSLNSQG